MLANPKELRRGFSRVAFAAGSRAADGRLALVVALAVGAVLRGIVLWHTSDLGTEIVGEQHYVRIAGNLLGGQGFSLDPDQPTSMRPPLYPWFVAGIWSVSGTGNFQAVQVIQQLIALLTAGLVYLLGRRVFGPLVGRYAAAVVWLYPSLILFSFMLLPETLFTSLLVAFLLLTARLIETPRLWLGVLCGLTLGLAALTRSVLWPLPFALCPLLVLLLQGSLKTRSALAAAVLAGYALVIGPWAIRNTRIQGTLTIVDTLGGINLRLGNYEHTPDDRMWAAVSLSGDKNWSYEIANEYPGRTLTEGQKERWAQQKALAYMRANPGTTIRRALIKLADFWGIESEFAAGVRQGLFQPPAWFAALGSVLIAVVYVMVVLAAAAGMWLAAPDWRTHLLLLLPVMAMTVIHSVVFGHPRYHIPLIPVLALYACAWAATCKGLVRAPRPAFVGAVITVVALVGVWIRQVILVDAAHIRDWLEHAG